MPIVREIKGCLVERFRSNMYWGIAHGCNTKNNMGKGIALSISKAFPDVLEIDKRFIAGIDRNDLLGRASVSFEEQGMIFNVYSQVYPGKPRFENDTQEKRYAALDMFFRTLNVDYRDSDKNFFSGDIFGIPKIGAGLAGGDWSRIKKIINDATPDMKIELVLYDE